MTFCLLHDCMTFFYAFLTLEKLHRVGRSIFIHRTSCDTQALGRLDKPRSIYGAAARQDRDE